MRAKRHSFLSHFAKLVQAENLEAARIGENCPRPGHESMQASEIPDSLDSRPQIKVISIAEENLDAEFFENVLRHSFHSSSRAYRHKHGSLDLTVRRKQAAAPGRTDLCPDMKFNGHSGDCSNGRLVNEATRLIAGFIP